MISFELNTEETELQRSTIRYAAEQVRPLARRCEEDGEVAAQLVDAFWALGLGHLGFPDRCGGVEVGAVTAVVVEEELAWGDAGVAMAIPRLGSAGVVTALAGPSDERLTTALRDDNRCFAVLTSPGSVTLAKKSGGFSLSGEVQFPAANGADVLLIPCRHEDQIVLLWMATSSLGVRVTVESHQLGLRAAPLGLVALDGCEISPDCVLAAGASASAAFKLGLERELLLLAARAVGIARASFEYAAQYATQRTTFGKSIADHQAIAFMVADMGIRVDAARALLWNAAWAVDSDDADRNSALHAASGFSADSVVTLTSDAVQILGGHGYIQDHPLEKWMRDARTLASYSAIVNDSFRDLWNGA